MKGFTLIELMISLFILVIVGILISVGLNSMTTAEDRITQQAKSFSALQLAMILIERDMQQIINLPITNPQGQRTPTLVIDKNSFTFTRAGFVSINTTDEQNPVERVSYFLERKQLLRSTQKIINKLPDAKRDIMLLLDDVSQLNVMIIPAKNPLIVNTVVNPQNPANKLMRVAVRIEIQSPKFGTIYRLIPLAINTFDENVNNAYQLFN